MSEAWEGSFRLELRDASSRSRGGGNVEIGFIDFQGVGKASLLFARLYPHTVISSALFLVRAAFSCDAVEALEELCLGLLHATCGLGVADCRCDPFQGIGRQPWT